MDEVNRDLVEGAKHGLLGTVDNRLWMGADRNHARAVSPPLPVQFIMV
jgi:hypothetical protein